MTFTEKAALAFVIVVGLCLLLAWWGDNNK